MMGSFLLISIQVHLAWCATLPSLLHKAPAQVDVTSIVLLWPVCSLFLFFLLMICFFVLLNHPSNPHLIVTIVRQYHIVENLLVLMCCIIIQGHFMTKIRFLQNNSAYSFLQFTPFFASTCTISLISQLPIMFTQSIPQWHILKTSILCSKTTL